MVDLEVPNNYALSPSEATPHLTINHDVVADLDSSNAFEGPEKLLEVWFAPSATSLPAGAKENGLKCVPTQTWVGMLDLVHCEILSVISSEHVDAYLLSESSMFVFPHKIILKTCGTTTLLLGLKRMLRIAAADAGFPFHNALSLEDGALATPYRVFYSRKNFLFPDKQRGPHRSWADEVKFLDTLFEHGSAYLVGKMNGDHWYLYITTPSTTPSTAPSPPRTPLAGDQAGAHGGPARPGKIPTGLLSPFHSSDEDDTGNDETLEILMTDLDPENAKQFYLAHASAVARDQMPGGAQGARRDAAAHLGDLSEAQEVSSSVGSLPDTSDETFDVFSNGGEATDGATTPLTEAEVHTTEGHALGTVVSDNCGLSTVYPTSKYPDAKIDAYVFTPCGFSANAVIPAPPAAGADEPGSAPSAAHYFTVHVTPEPNCSFASFETNVPGGQNGRETGEIIEHVVGIFKPGRFIVTLFEGKGQGAKKPADPYSLRSKGRTDAIKGYRRVDRIVHVFDDYDLLFGFFERDDWVGDGGARVGEEL